MSLNKEEIENKVIKVLAEKSCMDEDKIHPDSLLVDDLAMDSLDAVEAVFQFEDHYGMEIDDDDIRNFKTVKDIIDYLDNRLRKC